MAYYDLEEQEQISLLKTWWKQWGTVVIAAIVVGILTIAGLQGWQQYKSSQSEKAGALFAAMTKAMQAGDSKKAVEVAGQIVDQFGSTGYATLAALAAARLNVEAADLNSAKARLQWVIEKARDAGLKDVARMRLAVVLLDEKLYDDALRLLDEKKDEPQSNLLADLRGDVLLAKGNAGEARAAYQAAFERTDARSPYRNVLQLKIDALGDAK